MRYSRICNSIAPEIARLSLRPLITKKEGNNEGRGKKQEKDAKRLKRKQCDRGKDDRKRESRKPLFYLLVYFGFPHSNTAGLPITVSIASFLHLRRRISQ